MKLFVITTEYLDPETDAPLFWNNEDGWTELQNATVFTEAERYTVTLPREAWGWIQLPEQIWDMVYAYQYEADARAAALENEDVYPF